MVKLKQVLNRAPAILVFFPLTHRNHPAAAAYTGFNVPDTHTGPGQNTAAQTYYLHRSQTVVCTVAARQKSQNYEIIESLIRHAGKVETERMGREERGKNTFFKPTGIKR